MENKSKKGILSPEIEFNLEKINLKDTFLKELVFLKYKIDTYIKEIEDEKIFFEYDENLEDCQETIDSFLIGPLEMDIVDIEKINKNYKRKETMQELFERKGYTK
jgi:hypothetical protein